MKNERGNRRPWEAWHSNFQKKNKKNLQTGTERDWKKREITLLLCSRKLFNDSSHNLVCECVCWINKIQTYKWKMHWVCLKVKDLNSMWLWVFSADQLIGCTCDAADWLEGDKREVAAAAAAAAATSVGLLCFGRIFFSFSFCFSLKFALIFGCREFFSLQKWRQTMFYFQKLTFTFGLTQAAWQRISLKGLQLSNLSKKKQCKGETMSTSLEQVCKNRL